LHHIYIAIMSTIGRPMLTKLEQQPIEFIGKISKFTKDRRIICIPNHILEKFSDSDRISHYRIRLEKL
jgi:hypothetical protein